MPELPEVEVLARHLAGFLPGARLMGVTVRKPRLIRPHVPDGFARALEGCRLGAVTRRAKYLVFELVDTAGRQGPGTPRCLVAHLGMTGRMLVLPRNAPLPRHAAVVMELERGNWVFEDARGFGRMTWDATLLDGLGPEPLEPGFTVEALARGLEGSEQPIKVRLLDQRVLAGVGNIYASEALFRSGISPKRRSRCLKSGEVESLHAAIREVLAEAVAFGSSLPLAIEGAAAAGAERLFYFGRAAASSAAAPEERFLVYDREGQPCRRCGGVIRRIAQAGRSSYYCARCQHG